MKSLRFIPACAGNSGILATAQRDISVHPRVCGEQSDIHNSPSNHPGSSPRVRGTAVSCVGLAALFRFIPACAGNSVIVESGHSSVHGSSPRVRGTDFSRDSGGDGGRFIPACAGNRCPEFILWDFIAVHPRVCGEQILKRITQNTECGSSPRVRGTAPADSSAATCSAVHPRVCGEQK